MKTVNMHEAKTHLSSLVNEEFIIAKAGRPVAKVTPIVGTPVVRKLGWMRSEQPVPEDFDTMGAEEIAEMFGLNEAETKS